MVEKSKISDNVIRRLPRYIRCLDTMIGQNLQRASSAEISRQMGITASQVRQDLNCFGAFGQSGYGYNILRLREQIAQILGAYDAHPTIILGVGNLGHALVDNFQFSACGFRLLAAFDVSPILVGTELNGIPVLHIDELETFIRTHGVDTAVLTLPADHAAETARRLEKAGIRGIWNFTNRELGVLGDVVVENIHFSDSLLSLCYYLSSGRLDEE